MDNVIKKMDPLFKSWSKRSLSTLGKILIAKTFGISQAIYLMQPLSLKDEHYKRINAVLYKFIWNRHYLAAKAPGRIKRAIVTCSIKQGGLGLLDIRELVESLKIKALGRIRESKPPFLRIINSKINLEADFDPKISLEGQSDSIINEGNKLLKIVRGKLWLDEDLNQDRNLVASIRNIDLKTLIEPRGQNS